jgi:rod shape-determining protein MreC
VLDLLRRHKALVVVGVLLVLPLVLLFAQTRARQKGGGRGGVVGVVVDVAGGIERAMLWVTGGLSDGIDHYIGAVSSYEELVTLRRERMASDALQAKIDELAIENERLRGLARAAAVVDGPRPLGARVLARTGQPLTQLITLNRGSHHGVRRGDGVIGEDGVVGVVLSTGRLTSDVLLLTDPSSAIDVVVQKTRARGIVRGRGDADKYAAVVEDFDRLRDVGPGDAIVTSGIGQRFPPGLLVGVVVDVKDRGELTREALVRPATPFARLEHVAILVGRDAPEAPALDDDDDSGLIAPNRPLRPKKPPAPAPAPTRETVVDAAAELGDAGVVVDVDGGPREVAPWDPTAPAPPPSLPDADAGVVDVDAVAAEPAAPDAASAAAPAPAPAGVVDGGAP